MCKIIAFHWSLEMFKTFVSMFLTNVRYSVLLLLALFLSAKYVNAEHVYVDGKEYFSLQEAKQAIKDGSKIFLKAGLYTKGIYLDKDNIEIIGEKNVIFDDAAIDGKAALVLKGNNILVENIECQNIYVKDLNGACIRFRGKNITIRGVYAHDSQSGIMTSKSEGFVNIEFSRFERLGGKAKGRGYAHALYIKADEFNLTDSRILSIGGEGSGVKSRSRKTRIERSLLASLDAVDSRLIDVANYGELIVKHSILQQGKNSSNSQVIAYGLETKVKKVFAKNSIDITNNLFLLDREKANVIISYKQADEVIIDSNTMVGDFLYPNEFSKRNPWYISRKKAKLQPYPYLPKISELSQLLETIHLFGEAQ